MCVETVTPKTRESISGLAIDSGIDYPGLSMTLRQNQLWKKDDSMYRIVHLERLSVDYKKLDPSHPDGGTHHQVTKKEFCRLIKGATAIPEP